MWMVRGVRGATTVTDDSERAIVAATEELLSAIIEANQMEEEHIASIIFTTTPDLTAAYPAQVARHLGWRQVAVMGCQEIGVPGGLPMCIRILLHWNTEKSWDDIHHVYLNNAIKLRPDLVKNQ